MLYTLVTHCLVICILNTACILKGQHLAECLGFLVSCVFTSPCLHLPHLSPRKSPLHTGHQRKRSLKVLLQPQLQVGVAWHLKRGCRGAQFKDSDNFFHFLLTSSSSSLSLLSCKHVYVQGQTCTTAHVWRSEDNSRIQFFPANLRVELQSSSLATSTLSCLWPHAQTLALLCCILVLTPRL